MHTFGGVFNVNPSKQNEAPQSVMGLSGTFDYQLCAKQFLIDSIEHLQNNFTFCQRNGHDKKWTNLFTSFWKMKIPVNYCDQYILFWYESKHQMSLYL